MRSQRRWCKRQKKFQIKYRRCQPLASLKSLEIQRLPSIETIRKSSKTFSSMLQFKLKSSYKWPSKIRIRLERLQFQTKKPSCKPKCMTCVYLCTKGKKRENYRAMFQNKRTLILVKYLLNCWNKDKRWDWKRTWTKLHLWMVKMIIIEPRL